MKIKLRRALKSLRGMKLLSLLSVMQSVATVHIFMLRVVLQKSLFLLVLFFLTHCAQDRITGKKTLNYDSLTDEPALGKIRTIVFKIARVSHVHDFPSSGARAKQLEKYLPEAIALYESVNK